MATIAVVTLLVQYAFSVKLYLLWLQAFVLIALSSWTPGTCTALQAQVSMVVQPYTCYKGRT